MRLSIIRTIGRTLLPTSWRASAGRRLRQVSHFGLERYCPLCRSHVRSFLPHGTPVRPEALCPICHSKEAHRLAWLYLSERTEILNTPSIVLHVAPEPDLGRWLQRQPTITYLSGDIRFGVGELCMDLCQLPIRDDSVDLIYCAHVLNAVPDEYRAMQEVQRVLKPGGTAVMTMPLQPGAATQEPDENSPEGRIRLCNDPDIYRIYGEDLPQRFADVDLQIELEDFFGSLPAEKARRFGLQATPVVRCTNRV